MNQVELQKILLKHYKLFVISKLTWEIFIYVHAEKFCETAVDIPLKFKNGLHYRLCWLYICIDSFFNCNKKTNAWNRKIPKNTLK